MLDALIAEGRVAFLALALIAVEVVFLLLLAKRRPSIDHRTIVANGLSGAFLMLALQAALAEAGSGRVALWLSLSLVAHLADVAARLRRR